VTAERWRQIRDVFDTVLELPPDQRGARLRAIGESDPELRREVEELLSFYAQSDDLLTVPAAARVPLPGRPTDSLSMEGRRVGQYRITGKIGSGGMGSVYVAVRDDAQFEQRVAIKLVRPGMDTEAILSRFLIERQVLASLDHPNIARLLDGGTTEDGLPYLVMEYVDRGTPVDRYCDERRLTVRQRLALFRSVCDAVHYAHRNLIVHRDLKPANILVTPDGVPKLLDFGIAKLLDPGRGYERGVTIDAAPMTPEFASPEQVRGDPVTTASDVYALGVLLYWLLAGRSPYRHSGRGHSALWMAITGEQPEPPSVAVTRPGESADPSEVAARRGETVSGLHRTLSGDLDAIVAMALAKEPAHRYPSAERLSDDLGRYLDGLPVRAHRESFPYVARKFVARHRRGVAVAAALAVTMVAATIVSVHYASEAGREKAAAERRFQEVRDLARFVLFNFDDAIQKGETHARKVFVERAFDYLNRLSKEAAADPSLQREVAEAYLKMGSIQGNLYGPHSGGAPGDAAASYRRALAMAEKLTAAQPDSDALVLEARANIAVGDLVSPGGDQHEALRHYRKAARLLELAAAAGGPAARQELITAAYKTGFVLSRLGDAGAALENYRRSLDLAVEWTAREPSSTEARRRRAMAQARVGEILSGQGNRREGIPLMRQALEEYESLLLEGAVPPSVRRDVLATSILTGDVLKAGGELAEAAAKYRRALQLSENLSELDPANRQYQRDRHIALGRLADTLAALGRRDEARSMTRKALTVLRPLVDAAEPSAYDLQQYVWLLVTTPFEELRDPRAAVPYAQKAVLLTKASHPATLDALARAYHGAGLIEKAIETEEKALALLPPPAAGERASALRQELEANLAMFRKSLPQRAHR